MTSWVRAESSVPTSGTAMTPSHSLITGVDSSSMARGLVGDDLLPGRRVGLEGEQAEVVDHPGEGQVLGRQVGGVGDQLVDRVLEREHPERRLAGE